MMCPEELAKKYIQTFLYRKSTTVFWLKKQKIVSIAVSTLPTQNRDIFLCFCLPVLYKQILRSDVKENLYNQ